MRIVPYIAMFGLAIFLFGGSFLFWENAFEQDITLRIAQLAPLETSKVKGKTVIKETEDTVTLLLVGDIMLDRGVEVYMRKNENWSWPFLNIADTLESADIVFGNLESQISDKGERVGSIYSFRADPNTIEGLVFAGFDVLSVANNHSLDYGRLALEDSLSRLKTAGIGYTGGGLSKSQAHSPFVKQVDGTAIGFLSYTNLGSPLWEGTENKSGIAWADQNTLESLKKDIQAAILQADIVVVSIHAGDEYKKEPTEFQKQFAKTAIDEGARLVVSHHSHVVQPIEQYGEGWIAYGLGNFVFDQGFSTATKQGLMLKVLVQDKKIQQVIPIKTTINSSFQVELDN